MNYLTNHNNLLRWFRLNESSVSEGTTIVDYNYTKDLTMTKGGSGGNGVVKVKGPYGETNGGVWMKGTAKDNGYYMYETSTTSDTGGLSDFTINMWVNYTGLASWEQEWFDIRQANAREIMFATHPTVGMYFTGQNSGGPTLTWNISANLDANRWYMFTAVKNGTSQKIYVNGILVASNTLSSSYSTTAGGYIMISGSIYNSNLNGMATHPYSDITFWSRELTYNDLACLYNGTGCYSPPITGPLTTFSTQRPSNLNSTNIFGGNGLSINYTITDTNYELNLSNILLYYKTNKTTSNIHYYVDGQGYSGYFVTNYTSNISTNFTYKLFDNQVYPATYNKNEQEMELTSHDGTILLDNTYIGNISLQNVSNKTQYNFFEVYAKPMPGTTGSLSIYYCNSTYSGGNVDTNNNCLSFCTITATESYNHNHSIYSSHYLCPLAINTTTGKTGNIKVTPISYFMVTPLDSGSNADWNLTYISNYTSITASISSNTGTTYSDLIGTVDAHLHQFDGNDTLYYYSCVKDIGNLSNCSSVRSDLIDLSGLPPQAVDITNPSTGNIYGGMVNIQYTAATSLNGYAISHYNISLLNADESFNTSIVQNNSLNLNYNWNTTTLNGVNRIKVTACDIYFQCSSSITGNFTLNNIPSIDSIVYKTTEGQTTSPRYYTEHIVNITAIVNDYARDVQQVSLEVYDSDNNLITSDSSLTNISNQYTYLGDVYLNKTGTWSINITANDPANSIKSSITFEVIEVYYPVINSVSISDTTLYYGDEVGCQFNASDLNLTKTLDATITWFKNISGVISQVNTFDYTFNDITRNALYITGDETGNYSDDIHRDDKYLCSLSVSDGVNVTQQNSSWVTVLVTSPSINSITYTTLNGFTTSPIQIPDTLNSILINTTDPDNGIQDMILNVYNKYGIIYSNTSLSNLSNVYYYNGGINLNETGTWTLQAIIFTGFDSINYTTSFETYFVPLTTSETAFDMLLEGKIIESSVYFWNSYFPGWFLFIIYAITMLMLFIKVKNPFVVLSLTAIFLVLIGIQKLASQYMSQYALTLTVAIGIFALFSILYTIFYKDEVT